MPKERNNTSDIDNDVSRSLLSTALRPPSRLTRSTALIANANMVSRAPLRRSARLNHSDDDDSQDAMPQCIPTSNDKLNKRQGKTKADVPLESSESERDEASSAFAAITRYGPPHGQLKDYVVNGVMPGQGAITIPSENNISFHAGSIPNQEK
jgi:hypothetical protein